MGNFDGNFIADAVSIIGGQLVFTHDLQLDRSVVSLGISANDVAVLSGETPSERFVSVGSGGLIIGRWDNEATLAGNNWEGLDQFKISDDNVWKTATAVRCGDFDGDGVEDIAALTAGGTSIVTAFSNSTGWTIGPAHTLQNPAHQIAVVRLPGSPRESLACVGSSGSTTLYLDTGTTASLTLPPDNYRDVVGLEFAGTSWLIGLAVPTVTSGVISAQPLRLVSSGSVSTTFDLGVLDAASVAVSEMTYDDYPELALNLRSGGEILLLLNRQSTTAPYSITDPTTMWIIVPNDPYGVPDANRTAQLVGFDIDQDLDADLVFSDSPTGKLAQLENPLSANPAVASLVPNSLGLNGYYGYGFAVYDASNTVIAIKADLQFSLDADWQFTGVEIVMWRQLNGQAFDPDAVFSQYYSYSELGVTYGSAGNILVHTEIPEKDLPLADTNYIIRARQVTIDDETGLMESAGPATLFNCTFEDLTFPNGSGSTPISGGGVTPRPGGGGSSGPIQP